MTVATAIFVMYEDVMYVNQDNREMSTFGFNIVPGKDKADDKMFQRAV